MVTPNLTTQVAEIKIDATRKQTAVLDSCDTQAEPFLPHSPDQTDICRSCYQNNKEDNPDSCQIRYAIHT